MTSAAIQRDTVAAAAALAALVIVAAVLMEHVSIGVGVSIGLLVGALNGYAVAGVLERGIPFVAGAIMRIFFFSAIAIAAALLLRIEPWAVLLGVAAAQFVMVAASIRLGMRAQ